MVGDMHITYSTGAVYGHVAFEENERERQSMRNSTEEYVV